MVARRLLIPIELGAKSGRGPPGWTAVSINCYCTILAYSPTYSCALEAVYGLRDGDWTGGGLLPK